MRVKRPRIQVLYNRRDITTDILPYVLELGYSDAVTGKADELELVLSDDSLLWQNEWYPAKGDTVEVAIGFDDNLLPCGIFEVDEIGLSGPPDTVRIGGISAGISKRLRTKRSKNYENLSLRAIAQDIANRHGFTLQGEISDVQIPRKMQSRETDLRFLYRTANEYGYVFSVRGSLMTFTEVYGLEAVPVVSSIDRTEVISYAFTDKVTQTFASARVSFTDPDVGDLIEGAAEEIGVEIDSDDVLELFHLADSRQNADRIARAALHEKNTKALEGVISIEGNVTAVSGNNVQLTGFGAMSGLFHIEESQHRFSPEGGYTTAITVKRIGAIDRALWVPKNPRSVRYELL